MMYHNTTETYRDGWLICHDPQNVGKEQGWQRGIPEEGAKPCVVPSFAHQSFCYEHGIFWYQKRLTTRLRPDADHAVILCIGAADFLCETYLNGSRVGLHRGTENPFRYDVTELLNYDEENLLVFRVSKPYSEDVDGYNFYQIPHRNQRPDVIWPGHCQNEVGISGEVTLSLQPKCRIEDMYLVGNMQTCAVDIVYTLHTEAAQPRTARMITRVGNKRTGQVCNSCTATVELVPGETKYSLSVPLDDVQLWSVDDPFLYYVQAELITPRADGCGEVCHTLVRHTGFRDFRVGEDGFFYLNGKRIFLRCSHTGNAFPYSTHAIPPSPDMVRRDLYMAKASGLNMVRFISGAALPDQLDYADELGLMIYEEPVASWLTQNGPLSEELYTYDLVTMLERDRSHPSICIWGMLNETGPTPPFDECCRYGRELLPLVRTYDNSRLVLYSSGRFDGDSFTGSVANPGSDTWQCLWNREDENDPTHVTWRPPNPGAFFENVGDIHIYPRYPVSKYDRNLIRTVGCDVKRPVFLSENGTGSLFDTVWLTKMFDQLGIDKNLPDVRQIYHMNDCLMQDLKRYGFAQEYAFPQGMMQESYRLHARHRAYNFDMIRANPYINGYSITGLLDHSICGEGLWTMMREWKPGCVDAMQNGLAKLKWCMFFDDMHFYAGRPVRFEALIANEDQLAERDYPVCFRILGEAGVLWERKSVLHPTAEQLKGFSVPVLDEMITLHVPTGKYRMYADIEGAAVMDHYLDFYVTNEADITTDAKQIVGVGLGEQTAALLARVGVTVKSLQTAERQAPAVVLVDTVPETEREALFSVLNEMAMQGSRVVFANRHVLGGPSGATHYLAVDNAPILGGEADWLYHQEYLAKRQHPYFTGLPCGMMDWEYWIYMINGYHFKHGAIPDVTAAASFGTGCINPDGYYGGFNIGTYRKGKGAITINSFNLVENIGINPAADRLLLNILDTEAAAL
ncbi:MAG: hypothetical protein IJW40_03710 [Clostridia bacterium]|nr:hypothetical protein [Clostridia bacterium]